MQSRSKRLAKLPEEVQALYARMPIGKAVSMRDLQGRKNRPTHYNAVSALRMAKLIRIVYASLNTCTFLYMRQAE
jgi:uncharacterized membrane protein